MSEPSVFYSIGIALKYERLRISYRIKTLREDAQLAERKIIATQYRSRAAIAQMHNLFILGSKRKNVRYELYSIGLRMESMSGRKRKRE